MTTSYTGARDGAGRRGAGSPGTPSLTLAIGPAASIQIVAHFDPKNHADDRGTRVDLVARRILEHAESFRPTPREFLGGP